MARPLLGELLAYAGGALALVGAALSIGATAGQLGRTILVGIIGAVLLAAGQFAGDAVDPRRRWIRAAFWLLGHSALVQATSLLVSRQLSVTRAESVAAIGLVGIAIGGFLWTRFLSSIQQLAVFSSVLLLVEGLALTDTNAGLSGGPNYGLLAFVASRGSCLPSKA